MKPFKQFLTEQTADFYHSSFRPRIRYFFPLTHIGSYECAVDRLHGLKEYDPAFKDKTHGFIYKISADTSKSATVKDYYNIADPNGNGVEKISKWAEDLLKDPRIKKGTVEMDGKTFPADNRLKYVRQAIDRGWWYDFGDNDNQAAKEFINFFIYILESVGITSLSYTNQVECAGSTNYIILNPRENIRIIGKAKQIPLE